MSEIEEDHFLYRYPTNTKPRPTHQKTVEEIEALHIVERPLYRVQVSKRRDEFGVTLSLHDKDNDQAYTLPTIQETQFLKYEKKRVNHISLDAYLPRQDVYTQTTLPKTVTVGVATLPLEEAVQKQEPAVEQDNKRSSNIKPEKERLAIFLRKVQADMEKALTINETIDVFINDFHLVTEDDELQKDTGATELSIIKVIKSFEYPDCKKKMISCIRFQPQFTGQKHQYLATSFIENLSFEERIEISGRSFKNQILLWDYKDMHLFTPIKLLMSNLEIVVFEFKQGDPNVIIGRPS